MPVPKLKRAPMDAVAQSRGGEFWQHLTFEDLARQQGVRPVERLEDLLGGWPEDALNDGFEEALERYRRTSSWDEP